MIMMTGLFLGGMMVAAPAFAQGDAAANGGDKTVSKTEVVSTPAAKTCSGVATKACCASKGSANAGEVKATSANGGTAGKSCCAAKGSANAGEVKATSANAGSAGHPTCTKTAATPSCSKSQAMGGNVSETSANAGSSKKACEGKEGSKKACCAKKAEAAVQ